MDRTQPPSGGFDGGVVGVPAGAWTRILTLDTTDGAHPVSLAIAVGFAGPVILRLVGVERQPSPGDGVSRPVVVCDDWRHPGPRVMAAAATAGTPRRVPPIDAGHPLAQPAENATVFVMVDVGTRTGDPQPVPATVLDTLGVEAMAVGVPTTARAYQDPAPGTELPA